MADPVTDEAPDLEAYLSSAAALLGLPLDPAWTGTIVANLAVLHEAAALVGAFPLPDEAEAAPVFSA